MFISYVKPHKEITTATLARWIKEALKLSGIDVTLFKAHSVKSLSEILQMANWSNERTFNRFYNRSNNRSIVAPLVLN